ncbi:MAG: divergent polysaccharide deacetylase family protein [Chitinispirillaceae bacterium]|nr:divergent polysaccharide deacetylase family protein [Chitinispirillaceae bacterium]
MRLKPVAVLFSGTLLLLALLIGLKSGFLQKTALSAYSSIASALHLPQNSHGALPPGSHKIENIILTQLAKFETPESEVSIDHLLEDSTIVIDARIPRGKPIEWIVMQLCAPVGEAGYHVEDCIYDEQPVRCTIRLRTEKKGKPSVRIKLSRARRYFSSSAKMAIVIADFGFKATTTTVEFLSFPEPLTVSLVSSKKMSTWTAQIANEYRKEIVIMLPMEPLSRSYSAYTDKAVMIHYPQDKIKSLLRTTTESIPCYAGFTNLCGSRVLEDTPVMRIILGELKKDHGYFLINPVSRKSVAAGIARELDVPYRGIDIVLDSAASSVSTLDDTLHHAAMIAQKTGSVVLQGRATSRFITTLNEQLPYLQENGIKLVYLSEVVHHPQDRDEKNKVDRK